jgi:DNA-binding response OmpR family regulator
MPALTPRERELTERLDEANEAILQLRARLVPSSYLRYRSEGLTKSEAAVLDQLMDGRIHKVDALRAAIDVIILQDSASLNSVTVTVCKLRKRLRNMGTDPGAIGIGTHRGDGYSMSARCIANMEAWLLI